MTVCVPTADMKVLHAHLKNPVHAAVELRDIDFNSDLLRVSSDIEATKRRMLLTIKQKMHEAISVLSIEDIKFEIKDL